MPSGITDDHSKAGRLVIRACCSIHINFVESKWGGFPVGGLSPWQLNYG